jgi:hypothetical protein
MEWIVHQASRKQVSAPEESYEYSKGSNPGIRMSLLWASIMLRARITIPITVSPGGRYGSYHFKPEAPVGGPKGGY